VTNNIWRLIVTFLKSITSLYIHFPTFISNFHLSQPISNFYILFPTFTSIFRLLQPISKFTSNFPLSQQISNFYILFPTFTSIFQLLNPISNFYIHFPTFTTNFQLLHPISIFCTLHMELVLSNWYSACRIYIFLVTLEIGLSTLKQIRSHHRIVISHPKTISDSKSESLLGTLLFPDCAVTPRQLTTFALSRANATIPERDRPRKIEFKTEKCALSRRQKFLYDNLLNASKAELEISRVKISIFWSKFHFLAKISIFDQNLSFWPKFPFLTKI